jgi:hypothetical protein
MCRGGPSRHPKLGVRRHLGRQAAQRDKAAARGRGTPKAEIELDVGNGLWRDPRRGEIRLEKWAADWIQTRHDLRLTTARDSRSR